MVRLPFENSEQAFSASTLPHFAAGFIAITVTLVVIACLVAQPTVSSASSHFAEDLLGKALASPKAAVERPR